MAPIDAQQLLNALAPLLSGDGSIKGPVEAVRISSLMKDAYKMVSKCVYLNILKITSDLPTLEKFISVGGWETLNNWLQECKAPEYEAFLIEVLKVYKELPVTIDILKKNNAAKTIKQLVKSDVESIKILSGNIVDQWMKTVREGKGDDGEKKKDKKRKKEHSSSKDKEKSKDSNSVTSEGQPKPEHKHEHSKHRHNSSEEKSSKRPKTVKTLPPKFRSTGLEDQTIVPVKKKPIPENKPLPVLPKRSINSGEEPPEKKSRLTITIPTPSLSSSSTNPTSSSPVNSSPPEVTHGKIKIIPAKRLPTHEIHEDSGFMDSLSRAPRPGVVKKKKKLTSPVTTSAPPTTTTSTGPPQLKPAVSNTSPTSATPISPTASMAARLPSVPSFYKDTLETTTEEAAPQESNERSPSPEINATNLQMPLLSPERPITPTDDDMDSNKTGEEADKNKENGGEGVDENGDQKGLLTAGQTKRKKPKKKLRWADENRLRQFFYFELDETERENVNRPKDFQSLKKAERMMEGRAMDSARRLSHDNQLETIPWHKPELLDNVVEVVVPGCNSADKETQRQREQGVLQALFFSKAMLPDTPTEPDLESFDATEPRIIPLEDTTSSGEEYSYTYDNIECKPDKLTPDPPHQEMFNTQGSGLPPELTSILNTFSKNPPIGNNVPNDMMQNVKNMLAVIMQASQDNNQNEMIDKLRLALEPFRHEVPELFQMQPNFGMGGPPNMMGGPGGPSGPRPVGPGSGLLGAAPPGFAPLAGQRPPPPMFMGPGGPRGPGPVDEWGENMMGGPRGPMGPMRHGFPRPRGGPMGRGPMRGRGGNFGRGGRGGGGGWDRNGDGGDRSIRGDHNDGRGRGRGDRKRTVCRHFVAGGCKYGDTCSFLHPGVNGPA